MISRLQGLAWLVCALMVGLNIGVLVGQADYLTFDPRIPVSSAINAALSIGLAVTVPYVVRDLMERQRRDADFISALTDAIEKRLNEFYDAWYANLDEPLTTEKCSLVLSNHRRVMQELDALETSIARLSASGRRGGELEDALGSARKEVARLKRITTDSIPGGSAFPSNAYKASNQVAIDAGEAFRDAINAVRVLRFVARGI